MSKGLEALDKIAYSYGYDENILIINKSLKALEIIKSKPWLVNDVIESKGNYDVYKSWCNTFRADIKNMATNEEYNLLKEVLL